MDSVDYDYNYGYYGGYGRRRLPTVHFDIFEKKCDGTAATSSTEEPRVSISTTETRSGTETGDHYLNI